MTSPMTDVEAYEENARRRDRVKRNAATIAAGICTRDKFAVLQEQREIASVAVEIAAKIETLVDAVHVRSLFEIPIPVRR